MPYKIRKSIDIDFAHHVSGHDGACINIHGHTWKFEVGLMCDKLDDMGFVVDFKALKQHVLRPVHLLLDHSLALHANTIEAIAPQLHTVGQVLLSTRADVQPCLTPGGQTAALGYDFLDMRLTMQGARQLIIGGLKLAAFDFSPTSERLAEWLFKIAAAVFEGPHADRNLLVEQASIYETLHPVESVATFTRN